MNIAVIGLGYVGTVAAVALASSGHSVTGVDIVPDRVAALSVGTVPLFEPGLQEFVQQGLDNGRLQFCSLEELDSLPELVVVAVGTPSLSNGAADLSQVRTCMEWIAQNVRKPVTIVMKSTVPPGTGRRLITRYLEGSKVRCAYVSNPEFLREGNAIHDWFRPDRIVIGAEDYSAAAVVRRMYDDVHAPVVATDITSAELIKYAANAFLATKISFINEIASLCEHLAADIDSVANGIGLDPRIGSSYLKAGIGYGGSCFPKDVRALDFVSIMNGHSFELLRAVISVNNRQRLLPVRRLQQVLGNLSNKRIAVLGLAFKPDTNDTRDAPALDIIRMLCGEGAAISVYDPVVRPDAVTSIVKESFKKCRSAIEALNGSHAAVVCTDWEEFKALDWVSVKKVMEHPYLIVDGRNCLYPKEIRALGFTYQGIGRL